MDGLHRPVLVAQVLEMLQPPAGGVMLDCTVGRGGHAEALLKAAGPQATLIGVDLDEGNLQFTKQRLEPFSPRVRLFHANFSEIPQVLKQAQVQAVDVLLADLGISSSQLDDPARGLSFTAGGPLDMRLDVGQPTTAAELVNRLGEQELADLIYQYGEERYSRRIARAIVEARRLGRIEQTTQLAELVMRAYPAAVRRSRRGVHPATRTFQALRIAVNREMENLSALLGFLPNVLSIGGRAAIISFHSLEDRQVKRRFSEIAASGHAKILTKKPITPSVAEVEENPRSRSSKLRAVQRVM